ncbi:inactive polypeptide N-acetylgalactosaminyltransferase-like protein 5 [Myotis myotis]|uniref:Polypeptide N-acetylgalactosaminyltransferase like 5 n=1 Tax=Myotis myotis TaxID=51298 RepID=A0A7J7RLS9_MYOMY|nr:inactive polypeptide N-acetylgalactosaminyltransferase-like protein 5 [Myotis myotis]KAF6277063.1 polypeptide N-acetylgalactosaminyltransferase like 5 [Myotis myotis]
MRNVTVLCLLCGTLTLGILSALLYVHFHRDHVSNWQKKTQAPASIWKLDKKLQQQAIHSAGQIPRSRQIPGQYVRTERPNKDQTKEWHPFFKLDENFNYSDPEFLHGILLYGLNTIISKSLGNQRHVPDTRDKMCLKKRYPTRLPSASIVICFHNEEFNTLFRTVSSVMNLTPHQILEEIILVDDMSEFDDLKEKLDYHLEMFRGKIKVLRTTKREGLIRARLIGAAHASGDVLVFLDSHCEVNRVWLEPLLAAIAKDRKMVVCPMVDSIDHLTLNYYPAPIVRGAFNWHLRFVWDTVFSYEMDGPEGPTTPIRSPAMSGGIFAINRHYFNEIGQYDKDMNLWGAENLELSLRIWMCGGQLFILPCSRVGHVDRNIIQNVTQVLKALRYNNLRLVHVWLDEYKEQFFLRRPDLKFIPYGNISERVELRRRLGCKSFQWYLDTVFPELETSLQMKANNFH